VGYLAKVRRELLDSGSPLLGTFSQTDIWQRSPLQHAQVALERLFEPWEPNWRLPRAARATVDDLALVAVYRRRNAPLLERLVHEASEGRVALWALDEESPLLKEHTVGVGRGTRFELLNRLTDGLAPDSGTWLVVADDDVRFVRGSLRCSVGLARAAGLDLCQPSHSRWSYLNWEVNRHRPARLVRLCRFVEQGPLMILSPNAISRLTPLPEDVGMGWGLEAVWGSLPDLRTGILDAVTVMHDRPVGQGGYDTALQWEQAESLRKAQGWESWRDLQRVLDTWWAWQRTPPWLGDDLHGTGRPGGGQHGELLLGEGGQ
jgi:hypothetical protein